MTLSVSWLYLLTFIVLMAVPIAFMERLYRKRKERFFPFSDKLLRPPGYSAGQKSDELKLDLAIHLLGCFFLAYVSCAFIFLVDSLLIKIFGGLLVIGEIYLLKRSKDILNNLNKWGLGYAGELAVGQSLNQLMLESYHVFHDLEMDGKFNIDHVLVGRNGVFAIETKAKTKVKTRAGKKTYNVKYNGSALFFEDSPDFPHTKFIEQTLRQAQSLRKELTSSTGHEVKVIPVLVLPGWKFELKIDQNNAKVKLLNHNKLDALKNLKTGVQLENSEITRIIHQLKQKCEDLDMNRGRWED